MAFVFAIPKACAQNSGCEAYTFVETCENTIDSLDCVWSDGLCSENTTALETPPETLKTNALHQIIQADSEAGNAEWKISELSTFGMKFVVRGKEALTWALNIKDGGFHNSGIETSYLKVLTIVNSLFILGLLAIAAMWMFSIFIPRRYLRQVVLVFAGAVIFINFALPLNQLLIDTTNLLQRTLLTTTDGKIAIANIVETPSYQNSLGYQNTENQIPSESSKEMTLKLTEDPEAVIGSLNGLTTGVSNGANEEIRLKNNQLITLTSQSSINTNTEQDIFIFLMLTATGIAYFILALIFVARIVILWALLILSPILILLAIFRSTRSWFYNWLGIYGRWLLIGPLAALGIAVIVGIWQTVGLPIQVTDGYVGETFIAHRMSNISFYLPGKNVANSLSTTSEMMEYIIFLMMLYLPIFFAFALTRHKVLAGATNVIIDRVGGTGKSSVSQKLEVQGQEREPAKAGLIESMKNLVGTGVSKVTQTAFPQDFSAIRTGTGSIQSASNYLPEQLALSPMHGLMELAGVNSGSRKSRDQALEKLANPGSLADPRERQQMTAVRNEIENRAKGGHPEASIIMSEIQTKDLGMTSASTAKGETTVNLTGPLGRTTSLETREGIKEAGNKKESVSGKKVETKNPKNLKSVDKKDSSKKGKDETTDKSKTAKSDKTQKASPKNEKPNA